MIGEKWSPNRLKPAPLMSTVGGPKPAYDLIACSKIALSQELNLKRRKRRSDKALYNARNTTPNKAGP